MSEERISDLDAALSQLRAMMLMNYGAALLTANSEEEKREAFVSLITAGVEIISSAITSRRPHDEAMQVTLEQFPSLLTSSVKDKIELMAKIEASIERQGSTVQ